MAILTASEARRYSKVNSKINEIQNQLVEKIKTRAIKQVWNAIIAAMKDGDSSCIVYTIPKGLSAVLISEKFKIEEVIEEDNIHYIISWDAN